jgi:hypothetical protein
MLLRELFEQDSKTAVIAFGRLNPPTVGHAKLVEKIVSIPGDHFLFLSHTQKPKTDPLDFNTKLKFAKQFFPNITIGHPSVKTPVLALEYLQGQGYTDVIFVAGSDRVEGFQKLFDTYNGQPDKTGKIPFKFNSIRVVSAGERDPDADDVSGMSASKMRVAAASGELDSFAQGVPDQRLAKTMYDAVRRGMGVSESLSENQGITPVLLNKLEQYVDRLFATLGIDVEFTRHFLDRVNDPRNGKPITIQELAMLFKKTYSKWGKKIAQLGPDAQAVIKDMSTDINMPFVLNWDNRNKELDLVAKTVMRKKNFTTPNQEFSVENFADGKKPGRKGLAKRSGVNTKAGVSDLRKTAKNSSGEKQRMAHWLANMKAGKAKNK